jgi:hypothetical protein
VGGGRDDVGVFANVNGRPDVLALQRRRMAQELTDGDAVRLAGLGVQGR